MKIAQFRDTANRVTKVFAEDDISATLAMFTRISEWIEVDFPALPAETYRRQELQSLDREEQELRERLSRVAAVRTTLTRQPTGDKHG